MPKVLIYTNQTNVRNIMDYVNRSLSPLQGIYDAFTCINITATLNDIASCVHALNQRRALDELENWVLDYLVQKIENPVIEGIPISRESLKGIIAKPDCSTLFQAFNNLFSNIGNPSYIRGLDSYFSIENGVVKIADDLNVILTEENSIYATSDKQIEILLKIKAFFSAWEEFYAYAVENELRNYRDWVGDMGDLNFFDVKDGKVALDRECAIYLSQYK